MSLTRLDPYLAQTGQHFAVLAKDPNDPVEPLNREDVADLLVSPLPSETYDRRRESVVMLLAARSVVPKGMTAGDLIARFEHFDPSPDLTLERLLELSGEVGTCITDTEAMQTAIEMIATAVGDTDANATRLVEEARQQPNPVAASRVLNTLLDYLRYLKFAPEDGTKRRPEPTITWDTSRNPRGFIPSSDDLLPLLQRASAPDTREEAVKALRTLLRMMSGSIWPHGYDVEPGDEPVIIWAGKRFTAGAFLQKRDALKDLSVTFETSSREAVGGPNPPDALKIALAGMYQLLVEAELVPRDPPSDRDEAIGALPDDMTAGLKGFHVAQAAEILGASSPQAWLGMVEIYRTDDARDAGSILGSMAGYGLPETAGELESCVNLKRRDSGATDEARMADLFEELGVLVDVGHRVVSARDPSSLSRSAPSNSNAS